MERLRGKEFALGSLVGHLSDPSMKVGPQVTGTPVPATGERGVRSVSSGRGGRSPYPFQLSGGMARRVPVSTAVLSGASLILADEPTPGMDLEMALEALQCFRGRTRAGVVLITHDIDLAFGRPTGWHILCRTTGRP